MSWNQRPGKQNTKAPLIGAILHRAIGHRQECLCHPGRLPRRSIFGLDVGFGGCPFKKQVKNYERSLNVYENKGNMDIMPGVMSDICVDMTCL